METLLLKHSLMLALKLSVSYTLSIHSHANYKSGEQFLVHLWSVILWLWFGGYVFAIQSWEPEFVLQNICERVWYGSVCLWFLCTETDAQGSLGLCG